MQKAPPFKSHQFGVAGPGADDKNLADGIFSRPELRRELIQRFAQQPVGAGLVAVEQGRGGGAFVQNGLPKSPPDFFGEFALDLRAMLFAEIGEFAELSGEFGFQFVSQISSKNRGGAAGGHGNANRVAVGEGGKNEVAKLRLVDDIQGDGRGGGVFVDALIEPGNSGGANRNAALAQVGFTIVARSDFAVIFSDNFRQLGGNFGGDNPYLRASAGEDFSLARGNRAPANNEDAGGAEVEKKWKIPHNGRNYN